VEHRARTADDTTRERQRQRERDRGVRKPMSWVPA